MDREMIETGESQPLGMVGAIREMLVAARIGSGIAVRFRPRIFLGSLPLGLFWLVGQFADTQVSVGAAFLAALIVFTAARCSGIIKVMAVMSFSAVTVGSLAGAILDSDKAFLAGDVIFDSMTVALSIGSIIVGKPLFRLIIHEMYPGLKGILPDDHRVFVTLTAVLALHSLVIGTTRAILINSQSVGGYIVWSRITSLSVNSVVLITALVLLGGAVAGERARGSGSRSGV